MDNNNLQLGQSIDDGTYYVYLYVMENYNTNHRQFSFKLEGNVCHFIVLYMHSYSPSVGG